MGYLEIGACMEDDVRKRRGLLLEDFVLGIGLVAKCSAMEKACKHLNRF